MECQEDCTIQRTQQRHSIEMALDPRAIKCHNNGLSVTTRVVSALYQLTPTTGLPLPRSHDGPSASHRWPSAPKNPVVKPAPQANGVYRRRPMDCYAAAETDDDDDPAEDTDGIIDSLSGSK